jgi:hypothetical protein
MPPGMPGGAMCVQRFDDSLNSAIHTTYRVSLRSSSMLEPRDPLLKVLTVRLEHSEVTSGSNRDSEVTGGRGRTAPPKQQLYLVHKGLSRWNSVMIPPLVHQRRPCYDFYFL